MQRTMRIASSSSEVRARELANIAHGVAKSGRGSAMGPLMTVLGRSIERRLGDCNAQAVPASQPLANPSLKADPHR